MAVVEARIDGLCRGGRRRIKLCVLRPVSGRVDRKDKEDTVPLVYSYNTHTVQLLLSSDLFMLIFWSLTATYLQLAEKNERNCPFTGEW